MPYLPHKRGASESEASDTGSWLGAVAGLRLDVVGVWRNLGSDDGGLTGPSPTSTAGTWRLHTRKATIFHNTHSLPVFQALSPTLHGLNYTKSKRSAITGSRLEATPKLGTTALCLLHHPLHLHPRLCLAAPEVSAESLHATARRKRIAKYCLGPPPPPPPPPGGLPSRPPNKEVKGRVCCFLAC